MAHKMTPKARRTVDMIRGTLPGMHDGDLYVGSAGDAFLWVGEDELIHVSASGDTMTATLSDYRTGWEA